jgi:hypothetical protein
MKFIGTNADYRAQAIITTAGQSTTSHGFYRPIAFLKHNKSERLGIWFDNPIKVE